MEYLKIIGLGTIVALLVRPVYEFYYNRIKLMRDLGKIKQQLLNIPYIVYLDTKHLVRIRDNINSGKPISKLDANICSREMKQKIEEIDIPMTRALDYLNEATLFRVKTLKRIIDKQDVEFCKFLPLKDYKVIQLIGLHLDWAISSYEKMFEIKDVKEKINQMEDFNLHLSFASNFKRFESDTLFINRWCLDMDNPQKFPIFRTNDEYEFYSKKLG